MSNTIEQQDTNNTRFRAQVSYLFEHSQFYREKLRAAGFKSATDVGDLSDIAALPFTEKDELRQTRTNEQPVGTHLAAPMSDIARIYSTSGTTGAPSYIPLTKRDLKDWITISSRSYGASGVQAGQKLVSTYGAGPFVAGVTLDTFAALGLTHIPVGAGNTERLVSAIQLLKPDVLAMTPSYALHVAEWAAARDYDVATSTVARILVAGEPGGGEPEMRSTLECLWNAKVTEAMGIGDISVSLWGECEEQSGMHFSGDGLVHFELINPITGDTIPMVDGAEGELVYTHLRHQSTPLLRFRSRDHVRLDMKPCACGRPAPKLRCIGRTDDMLILRGVNVFPSAIREVVSSFAPKVTGVILVQPNSIGPKQAPPLPVAVELADGVDPNEDFAEEIRAKLRAQLMANCAITFVTAGSLPRSDYKSKLLDWSQADQQGD